MSNVKRQITAGRRYATGPAGLVASIMAQAYLDAAAGDPDAKQYFNGELYQHHLSLLGLPGDWKPQGL